MGIGTPIVAMAFKGNLVVRVCATGQKMFPHEEGPPIIGASVKLTDSEAAAQTSIRGNNRKDPNEESSPRRGLEFKDIAPGIEFVEVKHPRVKGMQTPVQVTIPSKSNQRVVAECILDYQPLGVMRQAVADRALDEAARWKKNFEDDGGSDSFKPNHAFLEDYYSVVYGGKDLKTKSTAVPAGAEGASWCGIFAAWCVWIAADPRIFWLSWTGKEGGTGRAVDGKFEAVPIIKGTETPTKKVPPSPIKQGDIVQFHEKDASKPVNHHGVVIDHDGTTVHTVEGNLCDPKDGSLAVMERNRPLTDIRIVYDWAADFKTS